METNAQKFWDRQAKRFDATERRFEPVYHDILAKTKTYLDTGDRLLDLGCATGIKTLELAGSVRQAHGLDISWEMIRLAQERKTGRQVANVLFSQGTIHSEELDKASFDKVVAFSVLHLLDDCDAAVRRVHELLKPGGLFISLTACFREKKTLHGRLGFLSFLLMKRLGLAPLHLNLFTMQDVEQMMKRQGFQIITSEKVVHGITACFLVARKG